MSELFDYLSSGETLSYESRKTFNIGSISVALNRLVADHNVLLHGTTRDSQIINREEVFATDTPSIALFYSLTRSTCGILKYPWDRSPQVLGTIPFEDHWVKPEKGYVHIILDSSSFVKNPSKVWEYETFRKDVYLLGRVEVRKDDFIYWS